jgi:antitoxin ParD1/3/4
LANLDMPMNIQLKPEQEKFIQDKIASGEYSNADDVITEALKLLEIRERKLKELRAKIAVGTEQIANGQLTDGEQVFARLQEKINRVKKSSRM